MSCKSPFNLKILLVEDEKWFRELLKKSLEKYGQIDECVNKDEALISLNESKYDLVIIDLKLGKSNSCGLEVARFASNKKAISIILSNSDSEELVKAAYEIGCCHYLTKDHFEESMNVIISNVIDQKSLSSVLDTFLKEKFKTEDPFLLKELKKLKRSHLKKRSILILGETGVGKGVIASLIHQFVSGDKKENFISLNTSAINEELMESEFFGHSKGSFTGAISNNVGKIKAADGGTLFLDEVGCMPLSLQKKLLKAIEEKEFFPVGSNSPVSSNFCLVSATCDNLIKKIEEGEFRSDLFHRLNGITITIPPLRERRGDIPLLINHFLAHKSRKVFLTSETIQLLSNLEWKGNVRELKSFVDTIVESGKGIIDRKECLTLLEQRGWERNISTTSTLISLPLTDEIDKNLFHENYKMIRKIGLKPFLSILEKEAVIQALKNNHHGTTKAMSELKMPHATFYRFLKKTL